MRKIFFIIVMMTSILAFNSNALAGFSFSFGPVGGPLPSGNYQASCNSCYMMGNDLNCSCQDENGFWDNTTMHVPHRCNAVENENGQLECTHWHHHHHHCWRHHHCWHRHHH